MSVIAISHAHRKHRADRADGGLHTDILDRSVLDTLPGRACFARIDAATDSEMPYRREHIVRITLSALKAQGFSTTNERLATQTLTGERVASQTGAS